MQKIKKIPAYSPKDNKNIAIYAAISSLISMLGIFESFLNAERSLITLKISCGFILDFILSSCGPD